MKTVVNFKLLVATLMVAIFMIVACDCSSQEEKDKTSDLVKQFNILQPGDIFIETIWNKPEEGFTLLLNKKVEGEIEYKLTIDDHDPFIVNPSYIIVLDESNYIVLIELLKE